MKHFDIDINLFPVSILVSIGGTKEVILEELKRYDNLDLTIFEEADFGTNKLGLTFWESSGFSLMWFKDLELPKDYGTIVHEAFHCAHQIISFIGITLSDETEEIYAYLIDYLVLKIIENI